MFSTAADGAFFPINQYRHKAYFSICTVVIAAADAFFPVNIIKRNNKSWWFLLCSVYGGRSLLIFEADMAKNDDDHNKRKGQACNKLNCLHASTSCPTPPLTYCKAARPKHPVPLSWSKKPETGHNSLNNYTHTNHPHICTNHIWIHWTCSMTDVLLQGMKCHWAP